MKNLYCSLSLCFFSVLTFGQIVNIPDANFKNTLVNNLCTDSDFDQIPDQDVDTNNDGEIQLSESVLVTNLYIANRNISSLTGIAAFSGLRDLYCSNNNLSTLDVSSLFDIFDLDCSYNQLVNLKLSSREYRVNCSHNLLTNIDFNTNNTQFDTLTLDISYNLFTNLQFPPAIYDFEYLTISNNPFISLILPLINVRANLICENLDSLIYLESHAIFPWSGSSIVILNNPSLENINLRNGRKEFGFYNVDSSSVLYWLHGNPIANCPSLQNLCVDDFELPATLQYYESTNVSVDLDCLSLGLQNENKALSLRIFPNPANNTINLVGTSEIIIESVAIYNPLGQLVKTLTADALSSSLTIDVSALKTGTYFMEIASNNGKTTKKFVKL